MFQNKSLQIGYKVLAVLMVLYSLLYGLLAPLPQMAQLGQSSRNIFYHVPMWFSMIVLMSISVYQSIRLLRLTDPDRERVEDPLLSDAKARIAALVGVLFNVLGLATGIIWQRVSWGENIPPTEFAAWWSWDPIQICALVALLIYLAYFLLRSSVSDAEQKAKVAAVYNIFAFATLIPLFFIVPRILPGLHPTADGQGPIIFDKSQISSEFRMILYPGAIGYILMGVWLYELRSRFAMINIRFAKWRADRQYELEQSKS
ncbi:MAG: cytochrome c biogenesis protein CcsA [Bacteroidota bacterium]